VVAQLQVTHVAKNCAFAIHRTSWGSSIRKLQCAPAEWRQTKIDASSFILSKNLENKNQNSLISFMKNLMGREIHNFTKSHTFWISFKIQQQQLKLKAIRREI
jgi:hypothetical protein